MVVSGECDNCRIGNERPLPDPAAGELFGGNQVIDRSHTDSEEARSNSFRDKKGL
jgi:hypothetical protein